MVPLSIRVTTIRRSGSGGDGDGDALGTTFSFYHQHPLLLRTFY